MRLLGEISHARYKISVFKVNFKFSVKFEDGLVSQIYEFREGNQFSNFQDISLIIDNSFIQKVSQHFKTMHQIRQDAIQEEESDSIIIEDII